jgi:hypothetical protein
MKYLALLAFTCLALCSNSEGAAEKIRLIKFLGQSGPITLKISAIEGWVIDNTGMTILTKSGKIRVGLPNLEKVSATEISKNLDSAMERITQWQEYPTVDVDELADLDLKLQSAMKSEGNSYSMMISCLLVKGGLPCGKAELIDSGKE